MLCVNINKRFCFYNFCLAFGWSVYNNNSHPLRRNG